MHIQKSVNTKQIGANIKRLRKSKNITQDQLGVVLGNKTTGKPLSRGQVSNLETGKRNLNIHQIKILADFFNISIETLGFKSEDIDTIDLLERAKIIFESDEVPINKKQDLYENIMKIYIDAKQQIKS